MTFVIVDRENGQAFGTFKTEREAYEWASKVEYAIAGEEVDTFDFPNEISVLMDLGYTVYELSKPDPKEFANAL